MPDIFDEVDEDLRADRARKLLQQYGGMIVAAALAVVVGAGAWQGWRWYDARETDRVAAIYIAALRQADGPQPQEALAPLQKVIAEGNSGYRTLARLRAAALKAQAGDRDGALALYDQVTGDGAADPLLRDLSSLQWATLQIDHGDPAAIEARLARLLAPDHPFRALASEAQALLALRQGRTEVARETFKRLAQDVTAPDGVRGRANGLLAQLGG